MALMNQLLEVYDRNEQKGLCRLLEIGMAPVSHMYANAQLEVTIDSNGDFVSASGIDSKDENKSTLIPVTEGSAGRGSGIAPHPLCDTLSYIAGDFYVYCDNDKQAKLSRDRHKDYMERLSAWNNSDYTHPKVQAICSYLSKDTLIRDLFESGIVQLDEDEKFTKNKISGKDYKDVLVRFRVLGLGAEDRTWKDASLIESYCNYFSSKSAALDLSYLSGHMGTVASQHPKGIISSNYGAKLISANDGEGFTYRGRFRHASEACVISYDDSQKLHSALTWLVRSQGVYVGSRDKRTFVCWNAQGKKLPRFIDEFGLVSENADAPDDFSYRSHLLKSFRGYADQFEPNDRIIVAAFDAATTGRLSIVYYKELGARDFMERLLRWGESCRWWYKISQDGNENIVQTPSFGRVLRSAYGRETDRGFLDVDDKLMKEQMPRLVKCMLEGWPVPKDMVSLLFNRASTPLAYKHSNREMVLSTACALIVKHFFDRKGDVNYMELNADNHDRSYLFGRLLAILEKVEKLTYNSGETREPNAIRYQNAFVNHPLRTWQILEDQLNPYFQKLTPGTREYYRQLIAEITKSFETESPAVLNQRLDESYLLGYYLQRIELNKSRKEAKNDEQTA